MAQKQQKQPSPLAWDVDESRPIPCISKVPQVTLAFWIIKILATTVGETGGLGSLRDARAVPILLPYLQPSKAANRGWIIWMAANALGTIGTEAVIAPLAAVIANDPDWFARLGAAEGLRQLHHPRAAVALQKALGRVKLSE